MKTIQIILNEVFQIARVNSTKLQSFGFTYSLSVEKQTQVPWTEFTFDILILIQTHLGGIQWCVSSQTLGAFYKTCFLQVHPYYPKCLNFEYSCHQIQFLYIVSDVGACVFQDI